MNKEKFTLHEIESMDYYDFMTHLGVPFFHIGGPGSTENLAELCKITKESKVLMVGCGSGFSACYLAKRIGCMVVGVDIALLSIESARKRALEENVANITGFILGDVYHLPLRKDSFDVVITEFVSQFLDKEIAFNEFSRVLKPDACVGINEMYRDEGMDLVTKAKIDEAENIFTEVTGLSFKIHTPEEWTLFLEHAGFRDIDVNLYRPFRKVSDSITIVRSMGGIMKISIMILDMLKYMLLSKKIRKRFLRLDKGKRILFNQKTTRKHVGYVLATARKSQNPTND